MTRNINAMQTSKRNRRLCKVLTIILVFLMFLSSVFIVVSAATNSWGVVTSQVDSGYFYVGGHGGSPNYGWSIIRQRCFLNCKSLVNKFNGYITAVGPSSNVITMLEYLYSHNVVNDAVKLRNQWNTFYAHMIDFISDTRQLVGYADSTVIPKVNGKEVTTDQYQTLYNQISEEISQLESFALELRGLYLDAESSGEGGVPTALSDSKELVNYLWRGISGIINDVGFGSGNTSYFLGISTSPESIQSIADAVSGVTKTFAYAIAVVLFGVNITTTALQNEILTLRGGIKVFARVILVKIWIDIAIPICINILRIINSLAKQILNTLSSTYSDVFVNSNIDGLTAGGGLIEKLIARIINFFKELLMGFPSLILITIMSVCIVIVIIKLLSRAFELTCLVSLSPIFFATLVGEESKRYFRRFISAFITTAGYIVYVAIVYAVGTIWISQAQNSRINGLTSFIVSMITTLPRAIIIIACCRVMVKPPKVLLSLTDGG